MPDHVLSVRNLRTEYRADEGTVVAVQDASFDLRPGEKLGIVGESGSGKSALALSLLGLVPAPGVVAGGEIVLNGRDIAGFDDRQLEAVRGREISLVFQDPMTSLDPVKTVGSQLAEAVRRHHPELGRREVRERVVKLMRDVEIPRAERRYDDYPNEYSGGMRQRIMIALALANEPDVVVADEPTTALDVTTQAQMLDLMQQLITEQGAAVVLITHNIAIVAEFCDTVQVMYAGRLVERGSVRDVFTAPVHPYTEALLQSSPRLNRPQDGPLPSIPGVPPRLDQLPRGCAFAPRCPVGAGRAICHEQAPPTVPVQRAGGPGFAECHFAQERLAAGPLTLVPAATDAAPAEALVAPAEVRTPLLSVTGLSKTYKIKAARGLGRSRDLTAVNDVSFTVERGESFGLVGESGCGKSTITRCLLRLIDPSAGEVVFDDMSLTGASTRELRRLRRRMQVVFQDPFASLDPRMSALALVEEALIIHGMGDAEERRATASEMLELVGITPEQMGRRPHAFSGGQRQRISVARALVLHPELVVLDEPVSALDVSIQAQVLNLLKRLQDRLGLTYVFIAHDLAVAEYFCDRIAVLYLGEVMELAPTASLFGDPLHPYTVSLLSAVPVPDPDASRIRDRVILQGEVGSSGAPSQGCPFQPRCPIGRDRPICAQQRPPLAGDGAAAGHAVACHFPGEFTAATPTVAA